MCKFINFKGKTNLHQPLSFFIGLRYTRSRRRNQFISLISLISMLGIALSVLVLITILSVLNGFDKEIKKQIFGMIAPITISSYQGKINHWQELEKNILKTEGVTAVAPFAIGQALLTNSSTTQPAMITGILPDEEKKVTALEQKMVQGDLISLLSGRYNMVLGEDLAKKLAVKMGDEIIVATPGSKFARTNMTAYYQRFKIVGIFRAGGGGFNFDTKLAFINLYDAQKILHLGNAVTALHINIKDSFAAPQVSQSLQTSLLDNEIAENWTEQLGEFFENIRLTKTLMFFIFVLIIAVAVFNLVSTMVMVVKNKQTDIAILRTMGATPTTILSIFIVQGAAIGLAGTLLGILGGVLLAWNISTISTWIQTIFNVQLISSNIYFVNYLPSELKWSDVWFISIIALSLSLLATLYPAFNAARVLPVDTLRYE